MGLMDFFKKSEADKGQKERQTPKELEASYIKITDNYRNFYTVDIGKWRSGHQSAISPIRPRYDVLMDVYEDALLDTHLAAMLQKRTLNVLNTPYQLIRDGEVDEELTKLFNKKWMYNVLQEIQKSIYYGYSPLTFHFNENGQVEKLEFIKRNHFIPQENKVLPDVYSERGVDITQPPYSYVNLLIKHNSLGLLLECAKYTIFKKHSTAHWQQLQQLFGIPMRIGRTNSRKKDVMDKIYNSLKNMGSAGFGVFPTGTEIEIKESAKNDPYKIFQEGIKTCNQEISMRVMGTHDANDKEGSFAREKVNYQRNTDITLADLRFCEFVIKEQLLPFLAMWNYDLENVEFKFVPNWQLPLADSQLEVDQWLMQYYTLPLDYIQKRYGVPVEAKTEAKPIVPTVPPIPKKKEPKQVTGLLDDTLTGVFSGLLTGIVDSIPEGIETPVNVPSYVESMVKAIYEQQIASGQLSTERYFKTSTELWDGVIGNYGPGTNNGFDNGSKESNWLMLQKQNIYSFSAAKSFAEMEAMKGFVFDGTKKRPFTAFRADALKVYGVYNENWLRTEYNNVVGGTIMGRAWLDIQRDKDIYPYLRYRTAGDNRVRAEHEKLEGITLRVDNPLWQKIMPKNGHNCRCPKPLQLRKDQLTLAEQESANSEMYSTYVKGVFDEEIKDEYWHRNTGIDAILDHSETNYANALPNPVNELQAINYGLKQVETLIKDKTLPFLKRDQYTLEEWFNDMLAQSDNTNHIDISVKGLETTVRIDKLFIDKVDTDAADWLTTELENILLSPSEVWQSKDVFEKVSIIKYFNNQAITIVIEQAESGFWFISEVVEAAANRKGVLLYKK